MSHTITRPTCNFDPTGQVAALVLSALTAALLIPGLAATRELRTYRHPDLNMQFTAAGDWRHRPRPGDAGTHERVDPETGIHVLMWHTSTEQDARRYLHKMSHMMDVETGAAQRSQTIDGRKARVLDLIGTIDGASARTLLAVIPSGKSRLRPSENDLYIVQIWCPVEDHARLAGRMQELLETVRITERPDESHLEE